MIETISNKDLENFNRVYNGLTHVSDKTARKILANIVSQEFDIGV